MTAHLRNLRRFLNSIALVAVVVWALPYLSVRGFHP